MQARLLQPADLSVTHPETAIDLELFVTDLQPERPEAAISYRVLLTRRVALADPKNVSVGKLCGGWVYELFLTSQPAASLPATTVLELYGHRGSFEQVLSDEDAEQDPDRWCSHRPCGQEFWQVLCQWVWNSRLSLGSMSLGEELRWTAWESGTLGGEQGAISMTETQKAVEGEGRLVETPAGGRLSEAAAQEVPSYVELRLSYSWMREPGPYAAANFWQGEGDTLVCPEGKLLRVNERRVQSNGELRVLYAARVSDCHGCGKREACLGEHESVKRGRRVSGTRQVVGSHQPNAGGQEQAGTVEGAAEMGGKGAHKLEWADTGGRRVRRELVKQLRRQQVRLTSEEAQAQGVGAKSGACPKSRAERAHQRRSWADRLARNACSATSPRWSVTLPGISPALAAYLGLPSASAS